MKQKTDALVEKLACKDLTFGQRIKYIKKLDYLVEGNFKIGSELVLAEKEMKYRNEWYTFIWGENYKYRILNDSIKDSFLVLGHPITLQTVLMRKEMKHDTYARITNIYRLWEKCGDKSLQEIIEEEPSGWEDLINYLLTIFK